MLTHLQYALSVLARNSEDVQTLAQLAQKHGLDYIGPHDPHQKTLSFRLTEALHNLDAAKIMVDEQSRGQFHFVPDTCHALNKLDRIKVGMSNAIGRGEVVPFEDDEDEE